MAQKNLAHRPPIATLPPFTNAALAVSLGLFGTQRRFLEFISRASLPVIKRGRDRVVATQVLLDALEGASSVPDGGELVPMPRPKSTDEILAVVGLQAKRSA